MTSQNANPTEPTIPPQFIDLEAEQNVLSILLLDSSKFDDIGALSKNDFYAELHQKIFQVLLDFHNQNQAIDYVILNSELRKDSSLNISIDMLLPVLNAATTTVNAGYFAKIVHESALKRRVFDTLANIFDALRDSTGDVQQLIDSAENAIFKIREGKFRNAPKSLEEALSFYFNHANDTNFKGIPTGYKELDERLTGFHRNELIIIAGRPSIGKSTFALNIVRRMACNCKLNVLIFSLEMGVNDLARNILAAQAQIDLQSLRNFSLADNDLARLEEAANDLRQSKIFLDDQISTTNEMLSMSRRMKRKHGIDLIVIDYLQLIKSSPCNSVRNREQEVAAISHELKRIPTVLEIPVIALSQLNRKSADRDDRRPMLSDLRDSGAIEQDADVVMLLHRIGYYDKERDIGKTEVIIAKQRNGPTGTVSFQFIGNQLRFE